MRSPREQSISHPPIEQDDTVTILEAVRGRRHVMSLPAPRAKAWEKTRQALEVVSADDVYAAWQLVRSAHKGVALGADSELFDLRLVDFKHKLDRWLNS